MVETPNFTVLSAGRVLPATRRQGLEVSRQLTGLGCHREQLTDD